jgi:tetratricopeptide (TPR) repeat protein
LNELNELHGFVDNLFDNRIIEEQFSGEGQYQLETDFDIATGDAALSIDQQIERNGHANGHGVLGTELLEAEIESLNVQAADVIEDEILTPRYETEVDKELESVRFYIENEYFELAGRTLQELRQRFGDRQEFAELDLRLASAMSAQSNGAKPLDIAEIRNEFGIDDLDPVVETGDYDTHYQMGIAYQEMGLTEEAIKEYQDAIALARPNDGSKRFFQCANLLGHCFMESGMANLALTWYRRALETNDLNEDEKQGIWYELARAYEAEGDIENAGRYFEQVYAENVDYRDVGECIKRLAVEAA